MATSDNERQMRDTHGTVRRQTSDDNMNMHEFEQSQDDSRPPSSLVSRPLSDYGCRLNDFDDTDSVESSENRRRTSPSSSACAII